MFVGVLVDGCVCVCVCVWGREFGFFQCNDSPAPLPPPLLSVLPSVFNTPFFPFFFLLAAMARGAPIEAGDRRVYVCAMVCALVTDTLFQRSQVFLDLQTSSLKQDASGWSLHGNVEKVGEGIQFFIFF